jgi:membrane protease YdiL (CAAX protease family)
MKCPNCQLENRSKALFCSGCGKKLVADEAPTYNTHVRRVSIFFFTLLGYIAIMDFTGPAANFFVVCLWHLFFAVIIIVFFIVNYKGVSPLFSIRNFKPLAVCLVLIIAFIAAVAVSYLGNFLNRNLFNKTEVVYYEHFTESAHPLLLCILFVGVFPALFEEMAFRGILFNDLIKITNTWAVILISSILFTLLHLSVISVIWLFPGAIGLGYMRARYNTINYGILAHFTYNTSIVLLQVYAHI